MCGTVLSIPLDTVAVIRRPVDAVPAWMMFPIPIDLFFDSVLDLQHHYAVTETEHDVGFTLFTTLPLAGMFHQLVEQWVLCGMEQKIDLAVPLNNVECKTVGVGEFVFAHAIRASRKTHPR